MLKHTHGAGIAEFESQDHGAMKNLKISQKSDGETRTIVLREHYTKFPFHLESEAS